MAEGGEFWFELKNVGLDMVKTLPTSVQPDCIVQE